MGRENGECGNQGAMRVHAPTQARFFNSANEVPEELFCNLTGASRRTRRKARTPQIVAEIEGAMLLEETREVEGVKLWGPRRDARDAQAVARLRAFAFCSSSTVRASCPVAAAPIPVRRDG